MCPLLEDRGRITESICILVPVDLITIMTVQWHHNGTGEGVGGVGCVTPNLKLLFLCLNLERTLDKRCGKMEVVRRRQLRKGHHFQR